ncbi:hypothetical protein Bca4012_008180 [Brassica carinata]
MIKKEEGAKNKNYEVNDAHLRWVKEEDRRKDLAMIQYGDVAEVDEEVKSSNTETSVVEGGAWMIKEEKSAKKEQEKDDELAAWFVAEIIKEEEATKNEDQEVNDSQGELEEEDNAQ